MSREHIFEFYGTKEDFLNILNSFPNRTYLSGKLYYFNDYIVKLIDDEIHFGVERGGHSGGYWFIPKITEFDERIEFCGTIRYIGSNDNQSKIRKTIDKIEEILLFVLLLPIVLIVKLYMIIEWVMRKICNRPKVKEKTTEERLFDLMENYMGCVRK